MIRYSLPNAFKGFVIWSSTRRWFQRLGTARDEEEERKNKGKKITSWSARMKREARRQLPRAEQECRNVMRCNCGKRRRSDVRDGLSSACEDGGLTRELR
ncbi:hypothetical protein X777_11838 [Ooceraea biroi]|uniref:Uncharacterized protein n=1 Tax=Ooceraea biroi TaxID=2015173 RepID=A0A026W1B6_OOCBI|nr:hypothetical protein X777_11838 [Ooceraea biroi]